MMRSLYIAYFFFALAIPIVCCQDVANEDRDKKLISTFQIVRFPNEVCVGSGTRNGTCYTSAECSDKGGTSAGSCADGFGVCCTFLITTCGSSSSENNTYWTQPTATTGQSSCDLTVCPASDNICRLRLDFTTFVITGPNTLSITQVRRRLGQPTYLIGDTTGILEGNNYRSNCMVDTFSVTGESPSSTPPTICGTNTGMHMYVDADVEKCNRLMFTLADNVSPASLKTNTRGITSITTARTWDITVQQIECTSLLLPPVGCTEYFYGSGAYTLTSYNYIGVSTTAFTGVHLANQHQRQCIRRERGKCVGCFATDLTGMNISGGSPNFAQHSTYAGGCCGYLTFAGAPIAGNAAEGYATAAATAANMISQYGWDCIIIPGAFAPSLTGTGAFTALLSVVTTAPTTAQLTQTLVGTVTGNSPIGPQICGQGAGIGPGQLNLNLAAIQSIAANGAIASYTVCTRNVPFTLEFLSDDLEGLGNTANSMEFNPDFSANGGGGQGFSITHAQLDC